MKLRFEVLGSGMFEGHTREGVSFKKMRMMGFVIDCEGNKVPATCDMGYSASLDSEPKAGETVVVDITSFDVKNAMASMQFASLVHVPVSKESKH